MMLSIRGRFLAGVAGCAFAAGGLTILLGSDLTSPQDWQASQWLTISDAKARTYSESVRSFGGGESLGSLRSSEFAMQLLCSGTICGMRLLGRMEVSQKKIFSLGHDPRTPFAAFGIPTDPLEA